MFTDDPPHAARERSNVQRGRAEANDMSQRLGHDKNETARTLSVERGGTTDEREALIH